MTKEEAIEYACTALDEIAEIVNKLNIYGTKTKFLGHNTTKQQVYEAIHNIQTIVNKINEVEDL